MNDFRNSVANVKERMAADIVDRAWEERDLKTDAVNAERLRRWRVKYEMLRREGVVL